MITNTLLTLALCRDGSVRFRSVYVYIIFSATDSPVGDLRWLSKNRGVSCFSGFPCRDASLRNEGCFFLVPAGRSLLRSTTVPERNRGRSPCITARVLLVFVGIEYMLFVNSCRILCVLCGLARGNNHDKGFACFCQKGIRVLRDSLRAVFASFAAWREEITHVEVGWG